MEEVLKHIPESRRIDYHYEEAEKRAEYLLKEKKIREDVEKELTEMSPEVIKKVLGKLKDINEEGLAYSTLFVRLAGHVAYTQEKLEQILRQGILSGGKHRLTEEEMAKDWSKRRRRKQKKTIGDFMGVNQPAYFNIIGRSKDVSSHDLEIKQSYYVSEEKQPFTIIFDISSFKEVDIGEFRMRPKLRTYADNFGFDWGPKSVFRDKKGKSKSHTERGFMTYDRISPKLFRGIILQPYYYQREGMGALEIEPEKQLKELLRSQLVAYKNKNDLLLPVYDVNGNLLWPKKMSYEEVKQFVSERDAGKREDDESKSETK